MAGKGALTEPRVTFPFWLGDFLFALNCINVNKLPVTLAGLFRTFVKTTVSSHREPRDANTTGTSHLGPRTLNESEGLCSLHKSGIVFGGRGCELHAIFRSINNGKLKAIMSSKAAEGEELSLPQLFGLGFFREERAGRNPAKECNFQTEIPEKIS